MRRCGMTLVEVLAVLVVLAAITGVGISMASGWSATRADREVESTLNHALRRAHLLARSRGGAELTFGASLQIIPASGPTPPSIALPVNWVVSIDEKEAEEALSLAFNVEGLSRDVMLVAHHEDQTHKRWWLLGVSGELIPVEASP